MRKRKALRFDALTEEELVQTQQWATPTYYNTTPLAARLRRYR